MVIQGREKLGLLIVSVLLVLVTFMTNFYGNADIYDYSDVAKFFAGDFDAKIRTSHSYAYGFVHTPVVDLMNSFLIFKVTSLLSLFLLVWSVYWISGKDKRALWLMLLSPAVWYMAPWISPIQIASLLFLWGWYFIDKYEDSGEIRDLFYSGLFVGLSWIFWDAILFFGFLLGVSFMWNKKAIQGAYFGLFVLIGVLPRLILDQVLFGFAFFGVIRHVVASLSLSLFGGFYQQESLTSIGLFVLILAFLPFYGYRIFGKKMWNEQRNNVIFVGLTLLLLLINSQVRFVLILVPIVTVLILEKLDPKNFGIQLAVFGVLSLLVVNPYLAQIDYSLSSREPLTGEDLASLLNNLDRIEFGKWEKAELLRADLDRITEEFSGESFVVGDHSEKYRDLANLYWGDVKEFVSIEDYEIYLTGEKVAEKEICSATRINSRRDMCFSASIGKAFNDATDYEAIKYGLAEGEELEGFVKIRDYQILNLFEKN